MMNTRSLHSELTRYEDIVTELMLAVADPENAAIINLLRRQLDDAKHHCKTLRHQIQQEREAFWRGIDFSQGDTQPIDTSAIRHAEMKHQPRHDPGYDPMILFILDETDYDPPIVGDER